MGTEILVGDLSSRRTGMGNKCTPQAFMGSPRRNFYVAGPLWGAIPDEEFLVAIPRHDMPGNQNLS
jgi:hypothetical protein